MPSRPNILLIMTDEERYHLPRPAGFSLPARERLAARGVSFRDFHVTTGMCSPSRSVIYTGQHVPLTEVYDNSNFPYVHDLDPFLVHRKLRQSEIGRIVHDGLHHPGAIRAVHLELHRRK